ncbi:XVIPCD domain-containing protein [Xanthomonas sp. WHRI 10064A]|uniref:XVIPCD domain-containing protein n=1 Tax=unclassified Xanthomonas TaxID=2643310 RepID=UPI002B23534C|nr:MULTISPECIES: XVIPCD domain-containing protein [unclassified Xanthomonas]MEA9587530.1 XVIPCD domain-containing protein [Xanthomonas sp. WHRI 10064B]MEA9615251.1 XVIPCD domain-containing protein [Xanthomonas sp. WHRI 10064A]
MSNASTGPDARDVDRNKQVIDDANDRAFNPTYSSSNSEYAAKVGSSTVSVNPAEQSAKYAQTSEQNSGNPTQPLGQTSLRGGGSLSAGSLSDADAKTTTFSLEADAQTGQQQRLQSTLGDSKLSIEAGASAGQRMRYALTLPGVDQPLEAARQVNPLQPESLPIGARAVMDTQTFVQSESSASLRGLTTQSKITEASGRSYMIERVDERHVRVVTGPNAAIEAVNALGVKAGPAQALIGRADSLGQSQVNSAQFDLADPRARAAMGEFVREGKLAPGVPGVDEMQTLERINFSSQQRLQLELGPLSADVAGNRNQGSQVRISTPGQDGYTVVQQLQYGDNVPLTIVRHYDGNATERVEQRSYRFEIDGDVAAPGLLQRLGGRNEASEEKAIAQALNSALSGEMTGTGAIAPGQKTTLEFSEAQMQALLEQTRTSADASKIGGSALTSLVGDSNAPAQSPEQFAIAMARNVGGSPYGFAERLQRIADGADGKYDGQLQRVDATVLPRPADVAQVLPDPRDPAHADHALLQQCTAAVERLQATPGPAAGMDSERLAMGSVVAARENGLQRVDHVVLGNDPARGFVVQGALDSPAHLRGSFDAKAAQEEPVATSLQRLQALEPGTERDAAAQAQVLQQETQRQAQAR